MIRETTDPKIGLNGGHSEFGECGLCGLEHLLIADEPCPDPPMIESPEPRSREEWEES